MAFNTQCAHCKNATWEIKSIEPIGANYKQVVLQCVGCGHPVGTLDYYNLGNLLKAQEKALAGLNKQMVQMQHDLNQVKQALQRR